MANGISILNGIQNQNAVQAQSALNTKTQSTTGTSFASVMQNVQKQQSVPAGAAKYDAIFEEASRTYGVSKSLLIAVAKAESNFNPNDVSHAGASGIMQLMPGTAKSLGVKNVFDPYENIMGGAKLLRDNIKSFGSVPLALAAYNAGPGAVKKYNGVPPYKETQNYVKKIMADLGDSAYNVKSNYFGQGSSTSSYGSSSSSISANSLLSTGGLGALTGSSNNLFSGLGLSGGQNVLFSGVLQSILSSALLNSGREAAAGDGADNGTVTLDKKSFQSLVSLLQMQMMMPSRIGEISD
nr:lytic transglycosylase domain-containing protein [uncultured Oribacterium sp.]